MKKLLLFTILLSSYSFAQNEIIRRIEFEDSLTQIRSDFSSGSITGDTILTGTATINVGADSVIITHGLGSAPLISNINVSPQENYQGMSYWVQDITANTFKIKMDTTIAFDDATEAISFSWQIFNADLEQVTTKDYVTPEQYNAVADGETNDFTALQNMFDTAADSSQIIFARNKTYRVTTEDTLRINKTFFIDLNGATIFFDNAIARPFLISRVIGHGNFTLLDYYDMAENVDSGSHFIKVPSEIASAVKKNDLIIISDKASYGGDGTAWACDVNTPRGELIEVAEISNDTIWMTHQLIDTYTTDSRIAIVDDVGGYIKNGAIKGEINAGENTIGLFIVGAKNFDIDNLEMKGFEYGCLYFQNSFDIVINNFRATDFYLTGGGLNYGLYLFGGQDYTITNSHITGGRHPIDMGSQDLATRDVIIANNHFDNLTRSTAAAFSTHQGCEKILITNNIIKGGVLLRGVNITLKDNLIERLPNISTNQVVSITPSNTTFPSGIYYTIEGNTIDGASGGTGGIIFLVGAGDIKDITVRQNKIRSKQPFLFYSNASGCEVENMLIDNNTIDCIDAYSLLIGSTGATYDYSIQNLDIINNRITSDYAYSTRLAHVDVNRLNYSHNRTIGSSGLYVQLSDSVDVNIIEANNNYFDLASSNSYLAFQLTDSTHTKVIRCQNNTFRNSNKSTSIVNLSADSVYYGGNIFNDSYGVRYSIDADYSLCYDSTNATFVRLINNTKNKSVSFLASSIDTVLIPSDRINSKAVLDSMAVMVFDSSFTWNLARGTDWTSTTELFSSDNTTSANTLIYYSDFLDNVVSQNDLLFFDMKSSVGSKGERVKAEVYYHEVDFTPADLTQEFWTGGTTKDANNKITVWADRTANSHDFAQADTSLSPTLTSDGVDFDGAEYLSAGDDTDFDFGTSDISIEAWVKTTEEDGAIISKYASSVRGWAFLITATGLAQFRVIDGAGATYYINSIGAGIINNNEWHHVTIVLDRNVGAYFYLDGVLNNQELTTEWTDIASFDVTNSADVIIAYSDIGQFPYDGLISSIRYYKQVLTADQILQLYNFGR